MNEAIQSGDAKKWELAMQEEYNSLMADGTWELTPLPKNRQSVGCIIQSGDAKKWELAIQEEYDFLIANGTWELTPLPKNR